LRIGEPLEHDEIARVLAWAAAVDGVDYYAILGVDARADTAAVKDAYHRFALAFHPDGENDIEEAVTNALRRVFQAGTEAYRVLTDPELRLRYDLALSRGELRLRPSQMPYGVADSRPAKPIDQVCRSAGAKLCAKRAEKLISQGNLQQAKQVLVEALQYDGGANPGLAERIEALELAIFAQGG
jgi:curved DNA-binding protein CbpA